ncbi:MAG: isoprenylcysteine carboxylmethyltransferase family protein [Pirellulaceae bacterium]
MDKSNAESFGRILFSLTSLQFVHALLVGWPTGIILATRMELVINEHPCLIAFFLVLLVVSSVEWMFVQRYCKTESDRPYDPKAFSVATIVGAVILISIWSAQFEYWNRESGKLFDWRSAIGVVASLLGIGLRASAIATLGPSYNSDIRVAKHRVNRGIYRLLKHPSELGLVMLGTAIPMVLVSWKTCALAFAILFPISCWRVVREEKTWNYQAVGENLSLP